jgi:CheY-like chemotaxis protein
MVVKEKNLMDSQALQRSRLLLIDDDPTIIAILADALDLLGHYEVVVAMDGAQGLEQLEANPPDCIIVDIRMPHLDGLQFIRALRSDPVTTEIPIVVLSAMIQDRDILIGLLSGADAYLLKPPKLDELLHAVHHALSLTAEQRSSRMAFLARNEVPPEESR